MEYRKAQGMRRAVILSAVPLSAEMAGYLRPDDYVIACDAGYRNAEHLGVQPDLVIGDFDSAPQPLTNGKTVVLPHIKDDTDTHFAARWAVQQGFSSVLLLGGLGGARIEHTFANISTGLFLARSGVDTLLADERSELRYLLPDQPLCLAHGPWMYLSVFPLTERLEGITIEGVFYPLRDAVLTNEYPLGVSNEFTAPSARLFCRSGAGLVILTRSDC